MRPKTLREQRFLLQRAKMLPCATAGCSRLCGALVLSVRVIDIPPVIALGHRPFNMSKKPKNSDDANRANKTVHKVHHLPRHAIPTAPSALLYCFWLTTTHAGTRVVAPCALRPPSIASRCTSRRRPRLPLTRIQRGTRQTGSPRTVGGSAIHEVGSTLTLL